MADLTLPRQLQQTVAKLSTLSKTAVPRAVSMAINKVATKSQSTAVRETAREVQVPAKLIRAKTKFYKASAEKPPTRQPACAKPWCSSARGGFAMACPRPALRFSPR